MKETCNQKVIPDKLKIEKYWPISNLCPSGKVFEKLIMQRIEQIQLSQNVDPTGNAQHGYNKCRSTATVG